MLYSDWHWHVTNGIEAPPILSFPTVRTNYKGKKTQQQPIPTEPIHTTNPVTGQGRHLPSTKVTSTQIVQEHTHTHQRREKKKKIKKKKKNQRGEIRRTDRKKEYTHTNRRIVHTAKRQQGEKNSSSATKQ